MLIVPALEYEKQRQQPADWNKVILHREGKFYRTYEWSLWLISVISYTDAVRMTTKDRHLRDIGHAEASINSYLGVMSHSASYNIRHHLFDEMDGDIIKAA